MMFAISNRYPNGTFARHLPVAVLLLTYPTVTLAVKGGASALLLVASLISLLVLALQRQERQADAVRGGRAICVAMCLPLASVLLSELWHGKLLLSAMDSPSRFVAAIPLFLLVRRQPARALCWSDLSFALGAYVSLVICLVAGRDWGLGRVGSSFLNPIHFGNIALLLGLLSVLSLHWWRKDGLAIRLFKIGGFCAGLVASLLTGSRGGWVAIPVAMALVLCVRGGSKTRWWRILLPVSMVLIAAALYFCVGSVQDRIHQVWSDLAQYGQGYKDTSIGIRFQIYEAAFASIPRHPVFGLGAGGFAESLQARVDAGLMTPEAAQFGRGEVHNQLLAYMVNYGLLGGIALLAIHLVPALLFWRCLGSNRPHVRRAGLLGLAFAICFFVFGLTVEMFDLKMTASFYAAMIALLAGIATNDGEQAGEGCQ